jgi:hypothetical protein
MRILQTNNSRHCLSIRNITFYQYINSDTLPIPISRQQDKLVLGEQQTWFTTFLSLIVYQAEQKIQTQGALYNILWIRYSVLAVVS